MWYCIIYVLKANTTYDGNQASQVMTKVLDELPADFTCTGKNSVGKTVETITIKEAKKPETPNTPTNATVGTGLFY